MPLLTSSPVSDQNRPDSPTKTAGETTTSESVGDNTRQKSSPLGRHRESSYANGEVSSTGLATSFHSDDRSGGDLHYSKDPQKPQRTRNPFIFPTTFQNNSSNSENVTSISAILESPAKENHSSINSPRQLVAPPTEDEAKVEYGNAKRTLNGEELRPELAKLPDRKRLASWGEVQEEPTTSTLSAHSLTIAERVTDPIGLHQEHFSNSNSERKNVTGNDAAKQSTAQSKNQLSISSRSQNSSKNRKSWDGVQNPGSPEDHQNVSLLERPKGNKERSCSDSNLMVRRIKRKLSHLCYLQLSLSGVATYPPVIFNKLE